MYRQLLTLFLIVWCSTQGWAQTNDVLLTGHIKSLEDSTPISEVHVTGLNVFIGTTTNTDGAFAISISPIDTLALSAIQFQEVFLPVAELMRQDSLVIYLAPKVYELKEVTIQDYSWNRFKDQFMTLELPPDKYEIDLKLPEPEAPKGPSMPALSLANGRVLLTPVGIAVGIGWDPMQVKQAKARRSIDKWNASMNYWDTVREKFNKDMVKRYVPITDDKIEAFMRFCKLDADFVHDADEYAIGEAIKDCYLAFIELPENDSLMLSH